MAQIFVGLLDDLDSIGNLFQKLPKLDLMCRLSNKRRHLFNLDLTTLLMDRTANFLRIFAQRSFDWCLLGRSVRSSIPDSRLTLLDTTDKMA